MEMPVIPDDCAMMVIFLNRSPGLTNEQKGPILGDVAEVLRTHFPDLRDTGAMASVKFLTQLDMLEMPDDPLPEV